MNLLDLARSALAQRNADNAPHYRWRVVMADGQRKEICALPELTRDELRELYPGTTLEPLPDSPSEAEAMCLRLCAD